MVIRDVTKKDLLAEDAAQFGPWLRAEARPRQFKRGTSTFFGKQEMSKNPGNATFKHEI